MAVTVGVAPTALVAAYHSTWRDRLVRWDVEETVRILSQRVGGNPTDEQVVQAGALRRALARQVLDTASEVTLNVLDTLRLNGHRLALISNATSDTAQAWPRCPLARHFDVAVFSCDVGVAKPDPAIYRIAAERLRADPRECFFIGDGADSELVGAAAVGMTALGTTEHNDTDPHWTGPTLANLGELPALLGQPNTPSPDPAAAAHSTF